MLAHLYSKPLFGILYKQTHCFCYEIYTMQVQCYVNYCLCVWIILKGLIWCLRWYSIDYGTIYFEERGLLVCTYI